MSTFTSEPASRLGLLGANTLGTSIDSGAASQHR